MSIFVLKGGTSLINVPEVLNKIGIEPGQSVADLGCGGSGHFVAPIAATVKSSGTVYAVDIQKKVLNSLEASLKLQNIGNVKTIWSNLEDVGGAAGIADESCDSAILANVLFQNTKHDAIMKEAARMIKKGGKLIVIDWKHYKAPFGPPDVSRVSPESVAGLAKSIGLLPLDSFDVGDYHYALIFRK